LGAACGARIANVAGIVSVAGWIENLPSGADQLRDPRKACLFDRPAALLPGGSLRQDPRTREANADTCWHLL
jgi:hypothetical protein